MNDFDDRITHHLEAQAGAIDLYGGDLGAVVARARVRRQRRRLGAMVALVAVVGAGAAIAVNRGDDGGAQTPIDVGPAPEAGPVESTLQWQVTDAAQGLGFSQSLAVGDDGAVYALSTEAGRQDPNQEWQPSPAQVYMSSDGVEWSTAGAAADLWATSLDAGGGRLYAVGTGPAAAAEGDPYEIRVAASTDGGGSWSYRALPLDVAGLKDRFGSELQIGAPRLAVGPSGAVLATVTISAYVDAVPLLPSDVDPRWGVTTTPAGVEVYGAPTDWSAAAATVCPAGWALQEDAPPGAEAPTPTTAVAVPMPTRVPSGARASGEDDLWCVAPDGTQASAVWPGEVAGPVVRTFTWAELGVDPELQPYLGGQVRAFLAADGATFEEVTADVTGDGTLSQVVPVATPDGFAIVAARDPGAKGPNGPYPEGTATVLVSPDGRTWSAHAGAPLSGWIRSAGLIGDRLAVVLDGATGGTSVAVSTPDGWAVSTPLDADASAAPARFVNDVAVGPLGAVALIQDTPDPIAAAGGFDVASESDGFTLHVADGDGAAQVVDAGGNVVAETASYFDRTANPNLVQDNDGSVVVLDAATGVPLATFSFDSIEMASADLYDEAAAPSWSVAHSSDGVTWSVEPLADLVDADISQAFVSMTDTQIVVRGVVIDPDRADTDPPTPQVVLVGTPAG